MALKSFLVVVTHKQLTIPNLFQVRAKTEVEAVGQLREMLACKEGNTDVKFMVYAKPILNKNCAIPLSYAVGEK